MEVLIPYMEVEALRVGVTPKEVALGIKFCNTLSAELLKMGNTKATGTIVNENEKVPSILFRFFEIRHSHTCLPESFK